MSEAGAPSGLSSAATRLAALAVLAAIALAAYGAVIAPIAARYRATEAEIADARALLGRFQDLGARAQALAEGLATLESAAPVAGLFIGGGSDAQAAARLQERIKAISDAAGTEIITIQTLPVTEDGDHRRVGLTVRMTADTGLLQQVFHEIEGGAPPLVLDNVFVRARTRTARAAGQHLDVSYDVFGFLRPDVGG